MEQVFQTGHQSILKKASVPVKNSNIYIC